MNQRYLPKIFLFSLVLVLGCLGSKEVPATTKVSQQKSPFSSYSIPSPIQFVIFASSQPEANLQNYNVSKLTQTQKEVDQFIREKTKIRDVNLTAAQGNGQKFVYSYENKTENKTQNWIITVVKNSQKDNSESPQHEEAKPTKGAGTTAVSPTYSQPVPPSTPTTAVSGNSPQKPQVPKPTKSNDSKEEGKEKDEKYVITGINYTESSAMSEEQEADMQKQFKKQQKQFDKLEKDLNKQIKKGLKELKSLEKQFDNWWH